jgi:hypothetical protein
MQISVECMGVDNLWSQTVLYNKSSLITFRRWNYNGTFCIRKNGKFARFIAKRDAIGKQISQ